MAHREQLVVWRDALDEETILIGRAYNRTDRPPLYISWISCHLDSMLDIFGDDIFFRLRDAQPEELPLVVHLNMTLEPAEHDD